MSEPIKIEPYYQAQGKQLVDCFFDKGLLSESLSRDGMDAIEELLGFYLQSVADSAARCAEITKKYKATARGRQEGEDPPRHEEEMRWIARAREAEARVKQLESYIRPSSVEWAREVCVFLQGVPLPGAYESKASRLLSEAIELGIIPDLMECGNIHDSGAGPTKCALPLGHSGPHKSADKREGWG